MRKAIEINGGCYAFYQLMESKRFRLQKGLSKGKLCDRNLVIYTMKMVRIDLESVFQFLRK